MAQENNLYSQNNETPDMQVNHDIIFRENIYSRVLKPDKKRDLILDIIIPVEEISRFVKNQLRGKYRNVQIRRASLPSKDDFFMFAQLFPTIQKSLRFEKSPIIAEVISDILLNYQGEELILYECNICDKQLIALQNFMIQNSNLTRLDLRNNPLSCKMINLLKETRENVLNKRKQKHNQNIIELMFHGCDGYLESLEMAYKTPVDKQGKQVYAERLFLYKGEQPQMATNVKQLRATYNLLVNKPQRPQLEITTGTLFVAEADKKQLMAAELAQVAESQLIAELKGEPVPETAEQAPEIAEQHNSRERAFLERLAKSSQSLLLPADEKQFVGFVTEKVKVSAGKTVGNVEVVRRNTVKMDNMSFGDLIGSLHGTEAKQ